VPSVGSSEHARCGAPLRRFGEGGRSAALIGKPAPLHRRQRLDVGAGQRSEQGNNLVGDLDGHGGTLPDWTN